MSHHIKIVTAHPDGKQTVQDAFIDIWSVDACLRHVGSSRDKMCVMDTARQTNSGDVMVQLAQTTPFTWISHTFIKIA